MLELQDAIRLTRTLIPDKEAVFGENENETMFSDAEIEDFLTVGRNNPLRASALANEAIATSEVLILKRIKTQDLQTDGSVVANSLLKKAQQQREQADAEDAAELNSFFYLVYPQEPRTPELTEYRRR